MLKASANCSFLEGTSTTVSPSGTASDVPGLSGSMVIPPCCGEEGPSGVSLPEEQLVAARRMIAMITTRRTAAPPITAFVGRALSFFIIPSRGEPEDFLSSLGNWVSSTSTGLAGFSLMGLGSLTGFSALGFFSETVLIPAEIPSPTVFAPAAAPAKNSPTIPFFFFSVFFGFSFLELAA